MGNIVQKYLLQNFCHFFICIATVKSLQSSRLFETILSNYYYWNAFVNPKRKKLQVKIVVTKLQETILYGTRRVVLLVHCIVLNVPISPQNPKTIWITILLRSTAPQNLISLSNVNFAFKSFQDFTLYVNIETLNTQCRSDEEQEMWMWNT